MVKSAESRKYKKLVEAAALGREPIRGPVEIHIELYRPRKSGDLDNFMKVALDSVQGILYENDSQIVTIWASRFDDKYNPRLEIWARQWI